MHMTVKAFLTNSAAPAFQPAYVQISRLLFEGRAARSSALWGHRSAGDALYFKPQ
jgi:hypothetical protein